MTSEHTYHAHVYFDATTLEQARRICEQCRDLFELPMGRVHERAVGPHPDWSCQLTVSHDAFADVVRWLALNREGLTVFVHPDTEDVIKDHTDHAIWLGKVRPLNLAAFNKTS